MLEVIEKLKFAQINDKRYYFSDGIVSLPLPHPFLLEIVKFKRDKNKKLKHFYNRKNINLFRWKNLLSKKTKEFRFIEVSYSKKTTFYHPNSLKRIAENNENINFSENTRGYILNGFWK